MAITVRGPRPIVQEPKVPAPIVQQPDNTELIKHLAKQVIELGRVVENLSKTPALLPPTPIIVPPRNVDIVATVERDTDGKMKAIIIRNSAKIN